MGQFKPNVPKADALMGSMRSMGYSFETAVADIIDNSISAECTIVRLLFPKTPKDVLTLGILDNGHGMSKHALFEAMRYGSSDSSEERSSNDLGRFGLGMKSASLSQCCILTVVSKQGNDENAYTWNYNEIRERKEWLVQEHTKEEIERLPYINTLREFQNGTLVLWSDFDILRKSSNGQEYEELVSLKQKIDLHLGLVFHRFLQDTSKNRLTICINNAKVSARDPFLENHQKTTTKKERSIDVRDSKGREHQILVKPFVLPYASDLSSEDAQMLGGIEHLRSGQGFYIYRNRRLIIWGTWFHMRPQGELTKNARLRVDIPNALDDIWGINIMKQQAVIPKTIKNRLKSIVEEVFDISIRQQTHRGRKDDNDGADYVWNRMKGRNGQYYYEINRENKLLGLIRKKMTDEDCVLLDMLLKEIECNFPAVQFYIDKSSQEFKESELTDERKDSLQQLAIAFIDEEILKAKQPVEQVISDFIKAEPFSHYYELQEILLAHYGHEN